MRVDIITSIAIVIVKFNPLDSTNMGEVTRQETTPMHTI